MASNKPSQNGTQWASIEQPVVPTKDIQAAHDQPSAALLKPGNSTVHNGDVVPSDGRVTLYVIKGNPIERSTSQKSCVDVVNSR